MKRIAEIQMYAIEAIGLDMPAIGCAQIHGHQRDGQDGLVTLSVGPFDRPIAIAPMTVRFAREIAMGLLAECERLDPKGAN
jgi:hypothetical protein